MSTKAPVQFGRGIKGAGLKVEYLSKCGGYKIVKRKYVAPRTCWGYSTYVKTLEGKWKPVSRIEFELLSEAKVASYTHKDPTWDEA